MEKRRQPEIIAGRVNADGSIAAGDGFTVVKSATGVYDVNLPGLRLISVTVNQVPYGFNQTSTGITPTSFRTAITNISNASVDGVFAFIAVGVQV